MTNKKNKVLTSKEVESRFNAFKTTVAVLIAIVVAIALVLIVSEQPAEAISAFTIGPLMTKNRLGDVVTMMVPLIMCGVGISIMYSANQFSQIAPSSFYLGALMGSIVGIYLPMPKGVHSIVAAIAGGLAGAFLAAIPAFLKYKWSASEVVSSLMLQYINNQFVLFILLRYIKDIGQGYNASWAFLETARLTKLIQGTRVTTAVIYAIVAIVFGYFFLYKSKWGYALRVVGQNQEFARYSGIAVGAVMLYSQIIGGFLCGMAGAVDILALQYRFTWAVYPSYASDGMMVGILAKYNPLAVPAAALFMAYMRVGVDAMSRITDMPIEFVYIIQGLVVMMIAADMFLFKWKRKLIVANSMKQEAAAAEAAKVEAKEA